MTTEAPSLPQVSTAEELLALPDDGWRYELVRGELRRSMPAGYGHGKVAARIGRLVGNHVEQHELGDVLAAGTGFVIERGPDTVRAPDASFVSAARLPADAVWGFGELAPDLAVEVLSPSDTATEVLDKVLQWLEAGVRLVWVLDPRRRTVSVHTPDRHVRVLIEGEVLDGGDVLPDFRVEVSALFA